MESKLPRYYTTNSNQDQVFNKVLGKAEDGSYTVLEVLKSHFEVRHGINIVKGIAVKNLETLTPITKAQFIKELQFAYKNILKEVKTYV